MGHLIIRHLTTFTTTMLHCNVLTMNRYSHKQRENLHHERMMKEEVERNERKQVRVPLSLSLSMYMSLSPMCECVCVLTHASIIIHYVCPYICPY